MEQCKFPLCKRHAEKNGYCIGHRIYAGEEKPKKGIAKYSEKRAELQKEYRKLVKTMLEENKRCEIKAPGCTKKAEGLHHLQKRSPKNMLDRSNLKRACNHCNLYIETNPAWAEEKGFSISKHKVIN